MKQPTCNTYYMISTRNHATKAREPKQISYRGSSSRNKTNEKSQENNKENSLDLIEVTSRHLCYLFLSLPRYAVESPGREHGRMGICTRRPWKQLRVSQWAAVWGHEKVRAPALGVRSGGKTGWVPEGGRKHPLHIVPRHRTIPLEPSRTTTQRNSRCGSAIATRAHPSPNSKNYFSIHNLRHACGQSALLFL